MKQPIEPFGHYLEHGWKEGRNPNVDFDVNAYLQRNPNVWEAEIEPLGHFLLYGQLEKQEQTVSLTSSLERPSEDEIQRALAFTSGKDLKFSVIMPTWNRESVICRAIDSCLAQTYQNFELIICDDGSVDQTSEIIRQRYAAEIQSGKLRYIQREHRGVSSTRNTALKHASAEWIAYLDSDNAWDHNYLLIMAEALLRNPKKKTAYANLHVFDQVENREYVRNKGFAYDQLKKGNYIDLNIYVHHRDVANELGMFDESMRRLVDWDLILRHTRVHEPIHVPRVLADYYIDRKLNNISIVENRELHRMMIKAKQMRIPHLPNIAIKIPAPPFPQGREWGDYYLALSLQRQLATRGYRVRIDMLDEWYREDQKEDDIVLVIRGLSRYETKPNHVNVLWNISHPDKVSHEEYNDYDLVLVASHRLAKQLSNTCRSEVQALLQFTDPDLFYPNPSDTPSAGQILFVGNSRKIYRRIIKDSIEQGIDVCVYGSRWEGLIPDRYIKDTFIPNHELSTHYSSAAIVFNDHWDAMRDYGFISNRIFDVGAAGGFVISDHLPDIEDTLGDSVVTYEDGADLKRKVTYYSGNPDLRQEMADRLRQMVLEDFSVTKRALEFDRIFTRQVNKNRVIRVGLLYPRSPHKQGPTTHIRLLSRFASESVNYTFDVIHLSAQEIAKDDIDLSTMIDVIILQRNCVKSKLATRLIHKFKAQAIPIVYEIDDDLLNVPDYIDTKGEYHDYGEAITQILKASNLVTVSTAYLKGIVGKYNGDVVVIPNEFDDRLLIHHDSKSVVRPPDQPVKILYMGSITHARDLAVMENAARRILQDYPDVSFYVIGGSQNPPDWLNVLTIPPGRFDYDKFIVWFQEVAREFAFGVAPVEDTPFARSKSYIKFLDYAAAGLPGIYSDVGQYSSIVRDGENGLLVDNSTEAWYVALSTLIENPEARLKMGQRAFETMYQNHRLSQHVETYHHLIASMI